MKKLRIIPHILDPLKNTKEHGKIMFGIEWKYYGVYYTDNLYIKYKALLTLSFIKPLLEVSIVFIKYNPKYKKELRDIL